MLLGTLGMFRIIPARVIPHCAGLSASNQTVGMEGREQRMKSLARGQKMKLEVSACAGSWFKASPVACARAASMELMSWEF